MPQRPDAHIIGDLALNRVIQICNSLGWACEVVQRDYGEDILVQPVYMGKVEDYKIWIQVKGTRNIERFHTKKYGYSINVSSSQALRWARSADLVIVVLWDIERDLGLWTLPKYSVEKMEWYLVQVLEIYHSSQVQTHMLRILFNEDDFFNTNELSDNIGWLARIDHYQRLLDATLRADQEYLNIERNISSDEREYTSLVKLVLLDFLTKTGVFSDKGITNKFLRRYRKSQQMIRSKDESIPEEQISEVAAMMAILVYVDELSDGKCGVYPSLLEHTAKMALELINDGFIEVAENM